MFNIRKSLISVVVALTLSLSVFSLKGYAQQVNNSFYVDEIAYYQQLVTARPDIYTKPTIDVNGPAVLALLIRPAFRKLMLKYPNTYQSIEKAQCTEKDRLADGDWVAAQQADETELSNYLQYLFYTEHPNGTAEQYTTWLEKRNCVKPGGYPLSDFVAYWEGPNHSLYYPQSGPNGAPAANANDCKIYFTFDQPFSSMAGKRFRDFAKALYDAGYNGDFKAYSTVPAVFMNYNMIVAHGGTPYMCKLAERVGRAYWGKELSHMGRGIDDYNNGNPLDWHQYLVKFKGKINNLPGDIRAFLKYQD